MARPRGNADSRTSFIGPANPIIQNFFRKFCSREIGQSRQNCQGRRKLRNLQKLAGMHAREERAAGRLGLEELQESLRELVDSMRGGTIGLSDHEGASA